MIKPNYSLNSLIFFNVFLLFLALISLDSIHARTMQRYSDNKVSEDDYNAGNYSVNAVCSDKEAGDLKVNKNENQTTSTDKYSNQKAEDTGIMEFKNVKVINNPRAAGPASRSSQGVVVAIDPITGELTVPRRPGKIPPPVSISRPVKSIRPIQIQGKGVAIPAPPSAISYSSVTIGENGEHKINCTSPVHDQIPQNADTEKDSAKDVSN